MAVKRKQAQSPQSGGPDGTDRVMLVSMALVVAAIVVGLHVQMGLGLGFAALVGMALFLGIVGFQAWRRSEAERAALTGELHRLEAEVMRLRATPPARAGTRAARSEPEPEWEEAPTAADLDPFGLNIDTGVAPADGGTAERYTGASADELQVEAPASGTPMAPATAEMSYQPDYWSYRPSEAELQAAMPPAEDAPPSLLPEPSPPSAVREDDVEMLQQRIKEMLYQVTTAEQARQPMAPSAFDHDVSEHPPVAAMGIEASLGALRAAAQSMRNRPDAVAEAAKPSASVPPPPLPHDADVATTGPHGHELPEEDEDAELAAVRAALAAGRVDVYLEPILGLSDQSAQHYEVSIRLRSPASEDLGLGEDDVLPGRGLLPLFDTARIQRSAIVAERLASRGKSGSVFSRASGEALIAPDFTRDMQIDFLTRPVTARQLVLTFTQADIRTFRAAEQRAVGALSALGFRFAISSLTDLDMNFAAMAKAGFGFVKLDAGVLAEGLPHPGGNIPAGDVCRFLAEQGFSLIVEGIDSEETFARVFGFGCLLGQGALFGGRRPVKADVVASPGQAAA